MKKFLQKKLKEQKGMTLIELLAVIVIIAIIAAIAIPAIGGIIENSRVGAIKSDAQNIMSAAELYFNDATETVVDLKTLNAGNYIDDEGSFEIYAATSVKVYKKGHKPDGTATATTATTIEGSGFTGGVKVTFNGSTRANIEAVPNSSPTGAGTIVIARNAPAPEPAD